QIDLYTNQLLRTNHLKSSPNQKSPAQNLYVRSTLRPSLARLQPKLRGLPYCTRSMRTFIVTGVFGRSPESRGTFEILSAMSCPSTTSPKIECLLSSHGVAATVRKNWLPFVPGPALAIESLPAFECLRDGWNSSPNLYP